MGHTSLEGDVEVSRPLERALLARLALARGAPVSPEQLVVDLWGVGDGPRPTERLRVVVSRLRAALGPHADLVQRVAGGYRTPVVPGDLVRSDAAAEQMHDAVRRGDHGTAREHALEALAQWRGPALAELRHVPFADAAAARLDDRYRELVVARFRAELELGDGSEHLVAMAELADRHPMDEPLRCLLATALYRAGRQADALAQLARLRAALAAELGADPGPETVATELLLLRQDPGLAAPRPAAPSARRATLKVPATSFVGRTAELAALTRLLGRSGVVTLVGPPGCGKSRLAAEAARRATGREVVPVALATVPAGGVVRAIAGSAGVVPAGLAVALQTALLVLDDAEHLVEEVGEVVAQLRRETSGLTVLVTSQRPLRIAEEVRHQVGPLGPDAAATLFVERSAPLRQADAGAVAAVCAAVDGLPLGIELAAGLTRLLTPAQLAERMPDGLRLLVGGRRDAAGRHASMRAALDRSHGLLADRERSVLRRIGVFADAFELADAEQVVPGGAVDRADVAPAVAELVDRSLIAVTTDDGRPRYRLLGTIRTYALDRLVAAGEAAEVRQRHVHRCSPPSAAA